LRGAWNLRGTRDTKIQVIECQFSLFGLKAFALIYIWLYLDFETTLSWLQGGRYYLQGSHKGNTFSLTVHVPKSTPSVQ
jgi:hypothetical protein